ncbi:MAG: 3'-5' exonuclease, partial [Dehalococcoidia bacterium]|nr:3'-5' exonuclease [Dehalococcoidia bacterium]
MGKLVREGLDPAALVVTTFTSKAGRELADRLARVLSREARNAARVGTFHGIALRVLKDRDAARWDIARCLDVGEATRAKGVPSAAILWSRVLSWNAEGIPGLPGIKALDLDDPDTKAYSQAVDVIRAKGLGLVAGEALARESGFPGLLDAWQLVDRAKAALGVFDFADVLAAYHAGLAGGSIRDRAAVVIVDEAQDNSFVQLEIARLLAQGGALVLVGDGRQAIYAWRGAAPEIFLGAGAVLGARDREIATNYRSGRTIVEIGNRVAEGKDWACGGAARAARADAGSVGVVGAATPIDEADGVARSIQAAIDEGSATPGDFAILNRTNAQNGVFEAALVERGIPCVVVGGVPFFARRDVKDVLAYVSLAAGDDLDALARVCNRPRRYLGRAFVAAVKGALGTGDGLVSAIRDVAVDLRRGSRDGALELANTIEGLRDAGWPRAADLAAGVLAPVEGAGEGASADDDKRGVVWTVAGVAARFASARDLLDFAAKCEGAVTKASEGDQVAGRVTVSTVHRAKGLEWTRVFVSATAGVFPHFRSEGNAAREAEEDRLFYVATSRARDSLILTWSAVDSRGKPAGPSVFVAYATPVGCALSLPSRLECATRTADESQAGPSNHAAVSVGEVVDHDRKNCGFVVCGSVASVEHARRQASPSRVEDSETGVVGEKALARDAREDREKSAGSRGATTRDHARLREGSRTDASERGLQRLRDGAPIGDGDADRAVVNTAGNSASRQSAKNGQHAEQLGAATVAVGAQSRALALGESARGGGTDPSRVLAQRSGAAARDAPQPGTQVEAALGDRQDATEVGARGASSGGDPVEVDAPVDSVADRIAAVEALAVLSGASQIDVIVAGANEVAKIARETEGVSVGECEIATREHYASRLRAVPAWIAGPTPADPGDEAPAPGARFVPVKLASLRAELEPQGWTFQLPAAREGDQYIAERKLDRGCVIRCYTSIPVGSDRVRDCAEDSIRLVLLGPGACGLVPVGEKEPWVCRTKGWRATLAKRVAGLVEALGALPACPACGSVCRPRRSRDGRSFYGCARYPECRGSRS